MTEPLRRLEDMPIDEQIKVLAEIKEYLMQLIYSEILPKMPLEKQIETLRVLDRAERIGPQSTPVNEDAGMLAEVLAEAEAILL
jgi:hypothetical protein